MTRDEYRLLGRVWVHTVLFGSLVFYILFREFGGGRGIPFASGVWIYSVACSPDWRNGVSPGGWNRGKALFHWKDEWAYSNFECYEAAASEFGIR